jgi:hypothetical protein
MYELVLLNKDTEQVFTKTFWNEGKLEKFLNKLKYSKKIKILSKKDYSKLYD